MSITDILIRSVSGYIFVVPGLVFYFSRLKKSGKPQAPLHMAAVFVFCYYLIGVLTMTGIGRLKRFAPRLALIPFLDMIRGPVDTMLNVILFLPLGLFLPLLYRKYDRISRAALTGFLFSLSIELIQMFGRGATDINDLITNTAGTCLGFLVYKLSTGLIPNTSPKNFQAYCISDSMEVLFLISFSFFIMVTIQPFLIRHLFGLG